MEWSLTQHKLLAYHRLMRTDKPIGALLLLWPNAVGAMGRDPWHSTAVDFTGVYRGGLVDARRGLRR